MRATSAGPWPAKAMQAVRYSGQGTEPAGKTPSSLLPEQARSDLAETGSAPKSSPNDGGNAKGAG